jgi:hypothetical protein
MYTLNLIQESFCFSNPVLLPQLPNLKDIQLKTYFVEFLIIFTSRLFSLSLKNKKFKKMKIS